jgi:hypothetical protein
MIKLQLELLLRMMCYGEVPEESCGMRQRREAGCQVRTADVME